MPGSLIEERRGFFNLDLAITRSEDGRVGGEGVLS